MHEKKTLKTKYKSEEGQISDSDDVKLVLKQRVTLVIRMNYAMNLMVSSFPSSYSFVVA